MKRVISKLVNRYTVGLSFTLLSTSALAAPSNNMMVVGGFTALVAIIGVIALSGTSSGNDTNSIVS